MRGRFGTIGSEQSFGDAAGLAWACYKVAMRRARLDGLHAAVAAAVAFQQSLLAPRQLCVLFEMK
jgi:hypothetical protein